MRFLGALLFFNPSFMSTYTTTIGHTIYMPKKDIGTDRGARILLHEGVHVGDYERWGLLFSLSYLLLLPAGLTMRAHWEWRAVRTTLLVQQTPILKEQEDAIVRMFAGPSYLYMWPFPSMIRKWIDRVRREKMA
jgi:hypothetical protein